MDSLNHSNSQGDHMEQSNQELDLQNYDDEHNISGQYEQDENGSEADDQQDEENNEEQEMNQEEFEHQDGSEQYDDQEHELHYGNEEENEDHGQNSDYDDDNYNDQQNSMSERNDNNENLSKIQEIGGDEENDEFDFLPPERKVRFKILRFINKLREKYGLNRYYNDPIGNKVAMAYARYLLTEKESDAEFNKISRQLNYWGNSYKVSCYSSNIDVSNDDGKRKNKYNSFADDIVDVHSIFVELEHHKKNLLSQNFNTVSFGCALNDEKVVVVDIFNNRDVEVDSVDIKIDSNGIKSCIVTGKIINPQFGVFCLRIVNEESGRELEKITVQHISYNRQTYVWKATFNTISKAEENTKCAIEVYLRTQPESIKYETTYSGNVNANELPQGVRVPFEMFPHPQTVKEEEQEISLEKKKTEEEERRRNEERILEKKERDSRKNKKNNNDKNEKNNNLAAIPEENDENNLDEGEDNKQSNMEMSRRKENRTLTKAKDLSIIDNQEASYRDLDDNEDMTKKKKYSEQLEELERNIEQLKRENEELQRKISYCYDSTKGDREDKNSYKDTNINESTYTDSLNSAANLYNELNTHRKKLAADEKRYHASIRIQEDRKKDVYDILMKYKEELIDNAEYSRKGHKISKDLKNEWFEKEKDYEERIKEKRIENYKYSYELQRKTKDLKKMEEYFEGLHLIDFEQLKIENNTLTEKIEDRNEEIHKLTNKIQSNVQILAHLQEKLKFVENECKLLSEKEEQLKKDLEIQKTELSKKKESIANNSIKQLNEKKKTDAINSNALLGYYNTTAFNIVDVYNDIIDVIADIKRLRTKGKKGISDLKTLEKRASKIKIEYDEQLKQNTK